MLAFRLKPKVKIFIGFQSKHENWLHQFPGRTVRYHGDKLITQTALVVVLHAQSDERAHTQGLNQTIILDEYPVYTLRNVDSQPLFCTFYTRSQNVSNHPCHFNPLDPSGKKREKLILLFWDLLFGLAEGSIAGVQ